MAKRRVTKPTVREAEAMKQLRFTGVSRLSAAMQKEFTLQSHFKLGYRNKEDVSNLPPYVLTVGSQNVLTNAAEQVAVRNGIELDGPAGDQNTYGIDSSYDFNNRVTGIKNLRKWGANLEVRYENPVTSAVTWINILSTLTATQVVNFTDFWDVTELKNFCLFVNGGPVYEWTGAVASYASSTADTITVSGSDPLSTGLNFYNTAGNAGKYKLLINGTTYTYTGAGLNSATAYNQSPTNNNPDCTTTTWNAQKFTTGSSATQIISATIRATAAAGQSYTAVFVGAIYTDNAGVPGTLVGSAIFSDTGVTASGNRTVVFTFNNLQVSGSTNYHLVVYSQQTGNLSVNTGTNPAAGTTISTNGGVTWSSQNGYLYASIVENDSNTTTFTGVTPDPTGAGIVVGDAIIQAPAIGVGKATTIPAAFTNDLISTFGNQVYYGSFTNQTVYVSQVNDYADCTYATPRLVGEGASVTLDAPPVGFSPQDDSMYISAGKDYWYQSSFQLSSDLSAESFTFARLKTTSNQGSQSQAFISKMKNNVIYVSYEPIFNTLGTAKDYLNSPQTVNLSDPIKYDMDAYDFTGGSTYYYNYFLYFTVPTMGVVRLYNVQKKYWEAPQVMPVGRFYQVDGQLYGHSYLTNESYQVFVPGVYNDNGNPINAIAAFPYVSSEGAQPNQQKFFNRIYTEGYISGNTALTVTVNYDFGAFSGTYSSIISGSDPRIIFNRITDSSLGVNTLGTQPIGTILNLSQNPVVPKFRIINTFSPTNSYEFQLVYSSYMIDANWALLRFGPAIGPARDMSNSITE